MRHPLSSLYALATRTMRLTILPAVEFSQAVEDLRQQARAFDTALSRWQRKQMDAAPDSITAWRDLHIAIDTASISYGADLAKALARAQAAALAARQTCGQYRPWAQAS